MSKDKNDNSFKSKIGGQALIEGIMMRGIDTAAMACRLPNGTVDVETWPVRNGKTAPWYTKTPFIRGCFNFVSSMIEGVKCTMKSAEKQITEDDEEEELSKFEQWLTDKFGDKLMPVIMIVSVVLAMVISVSLFKFLPMFLSNLLMQAGAPDWLKTVAEGIIKVVLLVGYFYVISLTESMRTTFEYHGAEHKTIACYEAKKELTVENIRPMSRFHPRCGTSFILIVILLSIIVGMFLPWKNIWVRFGLQLLLLIPESSVSYELIKLAGRYDNIVTRIISAPGLWMQRITTNEPNDKQIEVAIAALKPCLPKDSEDDKW
ncbi:MAG: DUF1385 domain-containing protein [Oscillospiraceae bacterium]|nr:DUF1385 domain-containing protein [Oscillospiraceae bacterium]